MLVMKLHAVSEHKCFVMGDEVVCCLVEVVCWVETSIDSVGSGVGVVFSGVGCFGVGAFADVGTSVVAFAVGGFIVVAFVGVVGVFDGSSVTVSPRSSQNKEELL